MKDEEMAEEYFESACLHSYADTEEELKEDVVAAFLAGLKAGRPQWHDLEKDPTDLPNDKRNVWCKWLDQYGEGWYDKDTGFWTLIYRNYYTHCIKAWCELPTYDKDQ